MHRIEQIVDRPIRAFNNRIAGYPKEDADLNWLEIENILIDHGKISTAEKIRQNMILKRNLLAEKICGNEAQFVTLSTILQKSTPDQIDGEDLTTKDKIKWRKNIYDSILTSKLLTNNQKDLLAHN
jgi:hypothetical protein